MLGSGSLGCKVGGGYLVLYEGVKKGVVVIQMVSGCVFLVTGHVHYIVIDVQDNTCYMHGSLPSAHTPTDFM